MADYRLAKSLDTLRTQVNKEWPKRSKISDGTIGDAAHAMLPSDHNVNAQGVVTALDLTHDPNNGFDAHKLADKLIKYRHPNLKYIISNRKIAGAYTGWRWVDYDGENPHDKHIHISVGVGEDGQSKPPYDSTVKWNLGGSMETLTRHDIGREIFCHWGRNATEKELTAYAKVEANELRQRISDDPQTDIWIAQVTKLKKGVKPFPKLPPGVYEIK